MRILAALALAALTLTACGGGDGQSDEDEVRQAVADYTAAANGDEPPRVCDLLITPAQLRRSQESRERSRERCRDRVKDNWAHVGLESEVRSVRVRGTSARVTLDSGEQARLRRVDDRWRILVPD